MGVVPLVVLRMGEDEKKLCPLSFRKKRDAWSTKTGLGLAGCFLWINAVPCPYRVIAEHSLCKGLSSSTNTRFRTTW